MAQIQGEDVGALLSHHHGAAATLSARSSSDEGDLAIKLIYGRFLRFPVWSSRLSEAPR